MTTSTIQSQKDYIKSILLERGEIGRNFTISQHIYRLAAIVADLKDDLLQALKK